ncbi:MAG: hypothetical protein M3R24_20345 [Chloroflexota bacterium]|nr:hypothetical protein [Chloroflexota bacterium]PLS82243.1 MAG: hypothetical protein CYG59_04640 [Chloroflexota bacterium]
MSQHFNPSKAGHKQAERINLALTEQLMMVMFIAIVAFALFSLLGHQVHALYAHLDAGFAR